MRDNHSDLILMNNPNDLMPIEIWTKILNCICAIDLKNIQLTCDTFNSISENPHDKTKHRKLRIMYVGNTLDFFACL